jgi:hypothetical protein
MTASETRGKWQRTRRVFERLSTQVDKSHVGCGAFCSGSSSGGGGGGGVQSEGLANSKKEEDLPAPIPILIEPKKFNSIPSWGQNPGIDTKLRYFSKKKIPCVRVFQCASIGVALKRC